MLIQKILTALRSRKNVLPQRDYQTEEEARRKRREELERIFDEHIVPLYIEVYFANGEKERKSKMLPDTTTIQQVLDMVDVDCNPEHFDARVFLDGAPLAPHDMGMTFLEIGLSEKYRAADKWHFLTVRQRYLRNRY